MVKRKDTELVKDSLYLSREVETFYEKTITRFGNSAKVDAPKSYIGRRAFVVILKD